MTDQAELFGLELQRERLPMWVVYDHPTDFPDHFVARLHFSLPKPEPTALALGAADLEPLRSWLSNRGYIRFERSPEDDPKIIETWMV